MATKGTYTALQKLEPIDMKQDQAIARKDQQFRQIGQDAIAQEEKREAKAEKKRKEDAAFEDKTVASLGKIKDVFSGINSLDEGVAVGVQAARNELVQAYRELRNAKEGSPESLRLKVKIDNLSQYSERVKQMIAKETEWAENLSKGMIDGSLSASQNKDALQRASGVFQQNNFRFGINPVTGEPTLSIGDYDANGNLIGSKTASYEDTLGGSLLPQTTKSFNLMTWKQQMKGVSSTQKSTIDKATGHRITNKQASKAYRESLNEQAEMLAYGDENFAKGIWVDEYKKDPKDFNADTLKNMLYADGMSVVSTEYGDQDTTPKTTKETKWDTKENGNRFTLIDEGGKPVTKEIVTGQDEKGNDITKKTKVSFTLHDDFNVGKGSQQLFLKEFGMTQDDEIYFEVEKGEKQASVKGVKKIYADMDELNKARSVEQARLAESKKSPKEVNDLMDKWDEENKTELQMADLSTVVGAEAGGLIFKPWKDFTANDKTKLVSQLNVPDTNRKFKSVTEFENYMKSNYGKSELKPISDANRDIAIKNMRRNNPNITEEEIKEAFRKKGYKYNK